MRNFYNILLLAALLAFTTSCEKTENILIEPTPTTIKNTSKAKETIKSSFLKIENGTTVSEDGEEKMDAELEYLIPTIKTSDVPVENPIETIKGTTIELDIKKDTE